jgi:hypothetical protein
VAQQRVQAVPDQRGGGLVAGTMPDAASFLEYCQQEIICNILIAAIPGETQAAAGR